MIKNIKNFLILFTLILALLAPVAANADEVTVTTLAELTAALGDSGSGDITLGADIALTAAIEVSRDVTVTGAGHKLTAASSRHFTITQGTQTFTNLTFDGNSASGGIDITGAATVTFNTVTFSNNKGTSGGAVSISNSSAAVTFDGATFTGNGTSTTTGGAVYVSAANTVAFSGTTKFDGNTAASGGAIYSAVVPTFSGTVTFGNTTANTATNDGGAIYISGTTGTLTLSNIFTFTGNKTTSTSGNGGGAVYSAGTVTVSGASFTSNTTEGSGGAIYAGVVTVSSGTFTTNTATSNGGAIYATGNVTVSGGTFTNNTATGSGGAIASTGSGAIITVSGGTFDGGTIATVNAVNGGAIYASGSSSETNITGGTFANNTASTSGGAIYSAGTVKLSGVDFTTRNKSQGNGTENGGGAIWADTVEFTSSTTTFSNQLAENGYGGAIFTKTLRVSSGARATFSGNEAGISGGALRIYKAAGATASVSSLSRMSFINNKSSASGGAVYTSNTVNLTQCYFNGNRAESVGGGALGADASDITVTVTSSYFTDNHAVSSGSSNMYGGAIYIHEAQNVTIEKSTFASNSCESSTGATKGGAIYTYGVSSQTTLENNSFHVNTVRVQGSDDGYGGAVHLNDGGSGTAKVSFCTFTGNTANGYGGGLAINGGSLNILGTLIVGNTSGLGIGGDVWQSSNATIASGGDNRVVSFGNTASSMKWSTSNGVTGATDDETGSWTALTFFTAVPSASTSLLSFAGLAVGASDDIKLPTIPLDTDKDGAINKAVNTKNLAPATDQIGTTRPQPSTGYPDIGAYEVPQSGSDDGSNNPYASYNIRSIKMSGIPNTLSIVGQTAILHATVTYVDGTTTTTSEPLTWTSSNTNVAVFENSSTGSIYTKGIGTTTITVKARNQYSDNKTINVIWNLEEMNTNIHPNVQNVVEQLNLQLNQDNINFFLMATEDLTSAVNDNTFKTAFRNKWGVDPKTIACDTDSFSANSSFTRAAKSGYSSAYTAGIKTVVNNQLSGALLPVMCVWSFKKADLASSFNTTQSSLNSMTDSDFSKWLFSKINIGFLRTGGKFLPAISGSNESALQSSEFDFEDEDFYDADEDFETDFVTAADAMNSGALSIQRGSDSVAVSMLAYIANVQPNGNTGSELLSASNRKLLVIPGGTSSANLSNISGTIWTAKASSSSNSNSNSNSNSGGGGGGGGCNALNGGALVILTAALLLFNKKHA